MFNFLRVFCCIFDFSSVTQLSMLNQSVQEQSWWVTSMGAEIGATCSVFPYDERMETYLRFTNREKIADLANKNKNLFNYMSKYVRINLIELSDLKDLKFPQKV